MNPSGDFNPANYSASNPYSADTGTNWQYIRILNNSPYLLQVTLAGQGSKKIAENFIEDIQVTSAYLGKVIIAPQANFPVQAISAALSTMVSIECYLAGEIPVPVAQPITTLGSVGNTVVQAQEIVNLNGTVLAPIINANEKPDGTHTYVATMNNDGSAQFGEGQPLVSQVSWDNQGNLSANQSVATRTLKASGPVILTTTNQETGKCGQSYTNVVAGQTMGPTTNFKCVMTNAPTSITLNTPSENVNANAPAVGDIDIYGFWLEWTAPGAGTSRYVNTYTTVGN